MFILGLAPAFEEPVVRELLAETSEAWVFRAGNGRLPLAGVEDISPSLEALESSGGAAGPEDFRPILAAARSAEAVRRALAKAESPRLSRRRDDLEHCRAAKTRGRGHRRSDERRKTDGRGKSETSDRMFIQRSRTPLYPESMRMRLRSV